MFIRMKIRSVAELKNALESVPDDTQISACCGSTLDGAVWLFLDDGWISLNDCSLDEDLFFDLDESEAEPLYDKDIFYDDDKMCYRPIKNMNEERRAS